MFVYAVRYGDNFESGPITDRLYQSKESAEARALELVAKHNKEIAEMYQQDHREEGCTKRECEADIARHTLVRQHDSEWTSQSDWVTIIAVEILP